MWCFGLPHRLPTLYADDMSLLHHTLEHTVSTVIHSNTQLFCNTHICMNVWCYTLQHTAIHCITEKHTIFLQHTHTHECVMLHTGTHSNPLYYTVTHNYFATHTYVHRVVYCCGLHQTTCNCVCRRHECAVPQTETQRNTQESTATHTQGDALFPSHPDNLPLCLPIWGGYGE